MTKDEIADATFGGKLGPGGMLQVSDVSFVDVNPIALGSVQGSMTSTITIFGTPTLDGLPNNISKEALRTVFIDRKFPLYYNFPVLPDCAWNSNNQACPPFGNGIFSVGQLGVDACPTGSNPIYDSTTCAQAASMFGFEHNRQWKDGELCYWCGGCGGRKKMRMSNSHGRRAKWVCQTIKSTV